MHGRTLCVAAVAILVSAAAWAQPVAGTNELTVFGGVSLIDAEQESAGTYRGPLDNIFRPNGNPFRPGMTLPSVVREQLSMGSSAEFGVRFGRYFSDRIAFEGDFSVAPSHDLEREYSFSCPDNRVCAQFPDIFDRPIKAGGDQVVAYHYGGGVSFDLLDGAIRPAIVAGIGGVTYDADGESETNFTMRVGGAVKAYFGKLGARIEVVDYLVPDHFLTNEVENDIHVRVGLIVGW